MKKGTVKNVQTIGIVSQGKSGYTKAYCCNIVSVVKTDIFHSHQYKNQSF